uniref:Putative GDSL-like lipase/acylhydrolase n=1 Tax=viral metagenome TaxID=1070528 RepID=A0A6M3K6S7_9ZZZZ
MKIIYIFGDSHSGMFRIEHSAKNYVPKQSMVKFIDRSSGVPTAYSIERHDEAVRKVLESIDWQPKDEMWFIFGEIDVRFHIFYHHQQLNISLDRSIMSVVRNYISYVKKLRTEGYNIHIVSTVPPQPNPSPFHWDPTYETLNPIRGAGITVEDRVYITRKLNDELKKACDENGIPFRDVYPYIVDPVTGCNIPEMTRDSMHYNYIGDIVIEKLRLEEEI